VPADHQKEESGSDATSAESAVSSEIAGTIDKQMSPAEKQLLYFKQHQRIMDKFYRVCLCLQVVYTEVDHGTVIKLLHKQKIHLLILDLWQFHFDGKLLPAISGGPETDRVAVLVTGYEMEKILAIQKVAQEQVNKWQGQQQGIPTRVESLFAAMSFDTTAANTGHINGACTLLQQKLKRYLLWLASRHYS